MFKKYLLAATSAALIVNIGLASANTEIVTGKTLVLGAISSNTAITNAAVMKTKSLAKTTVMNPDAIAMNAVNGDKLGKNLSAPTITYSYIISAQVEVAGDAITVSEAQGAVSQAIHNAPKIIGATMINSNLQQARIFDNDKTNGTYTASSYGGIMSSSGNLIHKTTV